MMDAHCRLLIRRLRVCKVEAVYEAYVAELRRVFDAHKDACLPADVAARGLTILRRDASKGAAPPPSSKQQQQQQPSSDVPPTPSTAALLATAK